MNFIAATQSGDILSKLFDDIAKLWRDAAPQYLKGAGDTLLLALIATAAGCIIGLFCGILQTLSYSKNDHVVKKVVINVIKVIVRIYVEVFRGTPMILQAVFIYFGLPYLTGNSLRFDVITAAYVVVSINTGAYMAETVRGGILSIDRGQTEGAMAIGMNHFQTMVKVILPQTLRNIIPQIGNNLIINIKDTSVMFIIGYAELFAAHKSYVGATYLYFPSAVVTMIIYLIMTVVCSLLLRLWEHLMDGPENFNLATTDSLALTSGMNNFPSGRRKKRWAR
ncbi:MAG: amino acid ABC transporter permease [Clostridia bacterium]|nr:amino acid ABC transporter permease [Clostridia bacterium]